MRRAFSVCLLRVSIPTDTKKHPDRELSRSRLPMTAMVLESAHTAPAIVGLVVAILQLLSYVGYYDLCLYSPNADTASSRKLRTGVAEPDCRIYIAEHTRPVHTVHLPHGLDPLGNTNDSEDFRDFHSSGYRTIPTSVSIQRRNIYKSEDINMVLAVLSSKTVIAESR